MPKKLSIITVTFNCESTLQSTIDSFKDQLTEEMEFIVIDGGSTDRTVELIKKNQSIITKWVSEKDNGIYDAMSKGLALATGEYISFMNSGDRFENILTPTLKHLKDSSPDVAYGKVNIYYENKCLGTRDPKQIILGKIPRTMPFNHQSCFIKKEIIIMNGSFDLRYKIAADFDLISKILKNKKTTILELNYPVAQFAIGGISSNIFRTALETYKSQIRNGLNHKTALVQLIKWLTFQLAYLLPQHYQNKLRTIKTKLNI